VSDKKEATARIKINKLLEAAGWRFFAEGNRNDTTHPNGNIFYSTEAALDITITEILRVVAEIQTHSKPVIKRFRDEPHARQGPCYT
jgi:hypothetical protein